MIPSDKKPDRQERERAAAGWGVLIFGLIGAAATIGAVTQLRRSFEWFYTQLNRSQSVWRNSTDSSGHRGGGYREEVWRRYKRRMQEEHEEEMERVERIRRMQSVFNREREKYKRSYDNWRQNGPDPYQYHQYYQRDDWYWKTDTSHKDQRTNSRSTPQDSGKYSMSHHYSVLGLDRSRAQPYSEAEIKSAFRIKAKQFHPDQNQDNKEAAEAKFKEVMASYEAIKLERKNG